MELSEIAEPSILIAVGHHQIIQYFCVLQLD